MQRRDKLLIAFIVVAIIGCSINLYNRVVPEKKVVNAQEPEDRPLVETITKSPEAIEKLKQQPLNYNDYIQFLSKDKNDIVSPESINFSIYTHAEILDDEQKSRIHQYLLGRNYFDYKQAEGFKIINQLWVNSGIVFNVDRASSLKPFFYQLDMSQPEATQTKNSFVEEQTEGYITFTDANYDTTTITDAMNVITLTDSWVDGTLETGNVTFLNKSGSKVEVKTVKEDGIYTEETESGIAYTMRYKNGLTFTAILPKNEIKDIDIDAFINKRAETVRYDKVSVEIPSFAIEASKKVNFSDLDLTATHVNHKVYNGDYIPTIYNTAKFEFAEHGPNDIPVSAIDETIETEEYENVLDLVFNKPFMFFVTDTINNDVTYIGVINELQANYEEHYGFFIDENGIRIPVENESFEELTGEAAIDFLLTKLDINTEDTYPFRSPEFYYIHDDDNKMDYGFCQDNGHVEIPYFRFAAIDEDYNCNIYTVAILLNNQCVIYTEKVLTENLTSYIRSLASIDDSEKTEINEILYRANGANNQEVSNDELLKVINLIMEKLKNPEESERIDDWYYDFEGCIYGRG